MRIFNGTIRSIRQDQTLSKADQNLESNIRTSNKWGHRSTDKIHHPNYMDLPHELQDLIAPYADERTRVFAQRTNRSNMGRYQRTKILSTMTPPQQKSYLHQAIYEGALENNIEGILAIVTLDQRDREYFLIKAAKHHNQGAVNALARTLSDHRVNQCFRSLAKNHTRHHDALDLLAKTGRIYQYELDEFLQDLVLEHPLTLVRSVVDMGANPRADQDMALCMASSFGNSEVVQYLLDECHADINAQNGSPLIEACIHGYNQIIADLIDRGADVEREHGRPVFSAIAAGRMEALHLLVSRGGAQLRPEHVALAETSQNFNIAAQISRYLNLTSSGDTTL